MSGLLHLTFPATVIPSCLGLAPVTQVLHWIPLVSSLCSNLILQGQDVDSLAFPGKLPQTLATTTITTPPQLVLVMFFLCATFSSEFQRAKLLFTMPILQGHVMYAPGFSSSTPQILINQRHPHFPIPFLHPVLLLQS